MGAGRWQSLVASEKEVAHIVKDTMSSVRQSNTVGHFARLNALYCSYVLSHTCLPYLTAATAARTTFVASLDGYDGYMLRYVRLHLVLSVPTILAMRSEYRTRYDRPHAHAPIRSILPIRYREPTQRDSTSCEMPVCTRYNISVHCYCH